MWCKAYGACERKGYIRTAVRGAQCLAMEVWLKLANYKRCKAWNGEREELMEKEGSDRIG